jgi:hypothetical protein
VIRPSYSTTAGSFLVARNSEFSGTVMAMNLQTELVAVFQIRG